MEQYAELIGRIDWAIALEWFKAATPLLAALIASFTAAFVTIKFGRIQAAIADRQANTAALAARTARNKLRLDLFERRVKVYDAASQAIAYAQLRRGRVEVEKVFSYAAELSPAKWLFGPEINSHLSQIQRELWRLRELSQMIPTDGKENEVAEGLESSLAWFQQQRGVLSDLMSPYLLFTDRDADSPQV